MSLCGAGDGTIRGVVAASHIILVYPTSKPPLMYVHTSMYSIHTEILMQTLNERAAPIDWAAHYLWSDRRGIENLAIGQTPAGDET